MTTASDPSAPPAFGERCAVAVILGVYLLLQLNNIRHHVFVGQDHSFHFQNTLRLREHPGRWFVSDFTNRPLLYWVGAVCLSLTPGKLWFWVPALLFVLASVLALEVFYRSSCASLGSPALRVAALCGVAFLPATVITCVVYAGDTAAMLPFALAAWGLSRALDEKTCENAKGPLVLAGAGLCLGNLAKFTFLFLPAGAIFCIGALMRWGRLSRPRAARAFLWAVVLPLAFSLAVCAVNRLQTHGATWNSFSWSGTGEMTWRDLLVPKKSDLRVLQAPTYWQLGPDGMKAPPPLLAKHGYSYPALLHLGIFTDVLGFARRGFDDSGAPRQGIQETFARCSATTGLLFSAGTLAALAGLWAGIARKLILPSRFELSPDILVWSAFALAWYLPLVAVLPFVHHAYEYGYWLPRLVLPSIWGFALALFGALDRIARGKLHWLRGAALAAVIVQSLLEIGSVWY